MIKFEDLKQSEVVFNEEAHTYLRGDEKLSGITSLIHSVLQLGVYPDANEYVRNVQIPKAGYYGTCIHKAIQMYEDIGIEMTKFPEKEHPSAGTLPAQDVSIELETYKRLKPKKLRVIATEFTVSLGMFATQVDSVLADEDDNIYLDDHKSNNLDYYPGGKEGLKEYLSWQLSANAVMFENQTGLKVKGLYADWIRKGDGELWKIERVPDEKVLQLLSTEILPKPEGGFIYINEAMQVEAAKVEEVKPVVSNSKDLAVPVEITTAIANLVKAEKAAKIMKEKLRELMEANGVTKWECDDFVASISKATTATSFDAKAFEAADPETYKKYLKTTTRKGSFTIKQK
jgi:hypothetical protein